MAKVFVYRTVQETYEVEVTDAELAALVQAHNGESNDEAHQAESRILTECWDRRHSGVKIESEHVTTLCEKEGADDEDNQLFEF